MISWGLLVICGVSSELRILMLVMIMMIVIGVYGCLWV